MRRMKEFIMKLHHDLQPARLVLLAVLAGPALVPAQQPQPSTSGQDFNAGPPKDAPEGKPTAGKDAVAPTSRVDSPNRTVGPQQDGSIVASNNQTLTPAGKIVELGAPVRAKAIALNPNASTHTAAVLMMGSPQPVVIFNTATGEVLQRFVPVHAGEPEKGATAGSFAGITYSSDGTKLLFSQDDNHVVLASVNLKTGLLTHDQRIDLPAPPADGREYHNAKAIIPGGVAFSANAARAFVTLNAANTLGVIDLASSPAKLIKQVPVGNAPNSVVVYGKYAYVTNEGGRPATKSDFTNQSDGTPLVVDRKVAFTITGTVSVVDIEKNREVATISVGLHPAGMVISGTNLYVANAYSDSLSIIDLKTNKVSHTLKLSVPIAGGTFGSGPDGVAVTEGGKAYVTLGQANATAIVDLTERDPNPVIGYIPTGYFPASIAYDRAQKLLVIADDKGLGSRGLTNVKDGVIGYNTHADMGVVNLIPEPDTMELAKFSRKVFANNHWDLSTNIEVGSQYVDPHAVPVAIPKHIGEPSLIKHVFLVVKENRTYDQMLGDVTWGNGAPALAVFAPAVPNQHALVRRFPLLDNTYAPSRQSADGHTWIGLSGVFYSTEIMSPDWLRSYGEDTLDYTPQGFLWTAAAARGLSVKLYGEWGVGAVGKKPGGGTYTWSDFYHTAMCKEGREPASACIVPDDAVRVTSPIPSVAKMMDPHFPPFNLKIPDQYRMDYWIPEFKRLDAANQVPNLIIMCLPNDHTAGTTKGQPYPSNYQADNDLALGRMVEAITHSKIWPDSAIFVEEDDSQSGTDHVDGHRQSVYVISPYTVAPQAPGQGKSIHTTYTAENMNRTIENILGIPPLTQFDLVASPMFDVFQNTPDPTPFDHVAATLPLNDGPDLGGQASTSYTPLQQAWLRATAEVMKGKDDKPDAVDPNFLNHVIWYATTNWNVPYPGENKVMMPGPFLKAAKRYLDTD